MLDIRGQFFKPISPDAGLDILNEHVHTSGNPVPYDVQNGEAHQEYIALVHVKHPEYINWAVRINKTTKKITHVSAGPILRNQDYRNEVRPPRHCCSDLFFFRSSDASKSISLSYMH